ncbi:TolC family protein [Halomonas sp. 328]|uniref:TolC family protein n=1 Tax=Halomonas sp. 328 TaxID=2776704 RepID=UPI0018A72A73|nr:TolC family protein [Halomonas sp. 328]MBF8221302.1 TolC family protein [Halomonas sp. 328]
MNVTAWTRLFILPLLVLLAPSLALAASLAVSPRLLPGGEADFPALGQELERLAAGRQPSRLVAAPGGVSLPGLEALETPDFLTASAPWTLPPLATASRVLLIGPADTLEAAHAALAAQAVAQDKSLSPVALADGAGLPDATLAGAQVALVLALPGHDDVAQRRLFAQLRDAGVAALALTDARQVTHGALLSSPGALDHPAYLRRLALRLDDLASGRRPEPLDSRPVLGRIWLNLDTAAVLDWAPSFSLLSEAHLVEARGGQAHKGLGLDHAVALALTDNLGLAASRQEVAVAAYEGALAGARYRPSLYLEATGRVIDDTRARSALGQEPERRVSGGAVLEQLLFSEPALAAIAIAEQLDRARRAELEAESLDLALQVARDFLSLLRLDASHEVLEADLGLARALRDQAQRSAAAGALGQGEVARFEAELAQARERLERVQADQARLQLVLNRQLGRDPDAPLAPAAPDLDRPEWLGGDARFAAVLDSPASLAAWQDRLVGEALAASRELEALGALRRAAQRELSSRRRAFWLPQVGLEARYTTELARDGEGERAPWESSHPQVQGVVGQAEALGIRLPETGQDQWSLGVSARLPLYAGGQRRIEQDRAAARLTQVALEDAEARLGLEARLRASSVELAAAWRRIALREDAQAHAETALRLAEAGWREGALSQVALLDARTSARQAGLAAAEARWQALQALVHLQRALGMTPGPMEAEARERLLGGASWRDTQGENR